MGGCPATGAALRGNPDTGSYFKRVPEVESTTEAGAFFTGNPATGAATFLGGAGISTLGICALGLSRNPVVESTWLDAVILLEGAGDLSRALLVGLLTSVLCGDGAGRLGGEPRGSRLRSGSEGGLGFDASTVSAAAAADPGACVV